MEEQKTVEPVKKVKTVVKTVSMRNHWFSHVAKTRRKMQRGKKDVISHRAAMRQASTTWGDIKSKLKKKLVREKKKSEKNKLKKA